MTEEFIQLGAVAVLFLVAIREFFSYLKTRKNSDSGNGLNGAILRELQTMNSNHLHALQETIESGNSRLVDVIHADNTKMIELLGEIKGSLRK